jgi:hypothetical protein
MGEWISVKNKLPDKEGVYVLAYNGRVFVSKYNGLTCHRNDIPNSEQPIFMDDVGCVQRGGVTHWMPLPEPPKESDAE